MSRSRRERKPHNPLFEPLEERKMLRAGPAHEAELLATATQAHRDMPHRPPAQVIGRVVNERGRPVQGVPVAFATEWGLARATTDARGRFALRGASLSSGSGLLTVDGPDGPAKGVYALRMAPAWALAHATAGRVDAIASPLVLTRIRPSHAVDFSKVDRSKPVRLTDPGIPGVTIKVAAGSAVTAAGRPYRGKASLARMTMDDGSQMIEVVAPGLVLRSPAKVTLPNTSGAAPGSVLRLVAMGATGGLPAATGRLRVTADGRGLETISGGLRGPGCFLLPAPSVTSATPIAAPPPAPTPAGGGGTATPPPAPGGDAAVAQDPLTLAVGTTLDTTVAVPGLSGPAVTYTITPQPLAENMTFNRGTGELTFRPAPGQVGRYDYRVTVSDGVRDAVADLPITVVNRPTATTEIAGQVVDEQGRPVVGVMVMAGMGMEGAGATTDDQGRFVLRGVDPSSNPLALEVDGPHFAAEPDFMMLMAPAAQFVTHPLYAEVTNTVPAPVVLPRVDLAHATDFAKLEASKPQDLTSPALPGVVLHVPANSAITTDGKPFAGKLALTPLPVDKLLEVLPPGIVPDLMVGVDGTDLMFETPATVTLPNTAGYLPGDVLELMSMNMKTGGFDVTGHLTVTDDGRSMVTTDGGLLGSSCLVVTKQRPGQGSPLSLCTGCQPTANDTAPGPAGDFPSPPRGYLLASDAGLVTGEYFQDYSTAPYQSQGMGHSIDLQYSSLQADPRPVLQFQPSVQASDVGGMSSITAQGTLGGVVQGSPVTYTSTSGLVHDQPYRVSIQADATSLATGLYPFDLTVTHHYGATALGGDYTAMVNVVNAKNSPYGAGWSIGGLQSISAPSPTGPVLITAGSQGTEKFDYHPGGTLNDVATIDTAGTVRLLSNDGMANLTVPLSGTAAAASPLGVVAGDFNGDGKADLAEVAGSAVTILTANTSGGFTLGSSYTLAAPLIAVATGNFTGHAGAVLDLALLANNGTVTVLPGAGTGTFNLAAKVVTTLIGGSITFFQGSVAAADFNADAKADLAVATTGDGKLQVLLGNGAGGFATPVEYAPPGPYPSAVVAADLTGDGKLDLATVGGSYTASLTMLIGSGTGAFTIAGSTAPYSAAGLATLTAGDFYGDGQIDVASIVFDAGGAGGFAVFPGSPSGSWGNPILIRANPSEPRTTYSLASATSDLNRDGRPDLVLAYGALSAVPSNTDANQFEPPLPINAAGTFIFLTATAPFTGRTSAASYSAPMGDTSTLVHNLSGTWTRTYTDGTVLQFDATGREVSEADRNGNTTTYAYVAAGQPGAGSLKTVTDPVGLVSTLAYDASGHLRTITDPAGRVTTFTVDANGNLTQATDPAGSLTQYGYSTPSNHRITTEVSPNLNTATAHYDGFGRLASEDLFGGTATTLISAAEERGLLAPGGSGPISLSAGYQGSVTDPNGHTTTVTFDAMGHPSAVTDALSKTTTFVRDMNGWPTSITDPDLRTTTYAYDTRGNVTGVTRPGGTSMAIAYDPNFSQPTRVTDYRGLITTFTLDVEGNPTRRTDPDLGHEDWTYNAAGQPLTDTDRNGHTTSLAYDARGRLTTITYPGASVPKVVLAYDSAGNLTSARDELGHATTYTYDPVGRVASVQDPVQAASSKAVSFTYDADGNLTRVVDALGHATSYSYDPRDRVIGMTDPAHQGAGPRTVYGYDGMNLTSATDPLGHATTYGYDNDNRQSGMTDALTHRTTWTYDDAGQLIAMTDANNHATSYAYDPVGRLLTLTLPGTAPNASGTLIPVQYTYGYNDDDRLTSVTDALNHTTTYGYDSLNRPISVTDALNHITTSTYDNAGNQTAVTDALNHITTYSYDVRDRLVSQKAPSGGGTTTFTYDDASRLTSVKDPDSNLTAYTYDDADRGATETDPLGKVTTYTHDLSGNLTRVTDRLGRITSYAYDADDREVVEQWIPIGGGTATYSMTLTYDAAGRETQVQDNSSKYAYGYDNADRLTSVDDQGTTGLPQVTLTYGLDNVGNRTSLADTKGGVVTYTYDVRNELTTLTQSGTGVSAERVDLVYDAALRMTTLTRYSDTAGTAAVMVTRNAYDAANRLTTLTHQTPGGTVVSRYAYTLDNADRLTTEARTWNTSSTDTVTYGYTDDDQLTSVSHTNGTFANEAFGYDANGNRNTGGYTPGTGNRASSDGTFNYAYDDEGNQATRTNITTGDQQLYKWDYRNRLVEVDNKVAGVTTVVAQYTYDALDRLIKVVEGGATRYTLYDGQTPLLDFDGTGATTARYLSVPGAIDEVLARQTSGGVAWYLPDRLGTVRDLVNNSGTVVDHVDYSGFGRVTGESSPSTGDRFKFAGMERDPGTGMFYDRARWYLSGGGRFISEDPTGFGAADTNFYRYTGNSPTNYSDPSGLDWLDDYANWFPDLGIGANVIHPGLSWLIGNDNLAGASANQLAAGTAASVIIIVVGAEFACGAATGSSIGGFFFGGSSVTGGSSLFAIAADGSAAIGETEFLVATEGDIAWVEIKYLEMNLGRLAQAVKETTCAKQVVIKSGEIINEQLLKILQRSAASGRPLWGGAVSELPAGFQTGLAPGVGPQFWILF